MIQRAFTSTEMLSTLFRLEPLTFTNLFLSLQQRLTRSDCDKEIGLRSQDTHRQRVLWSAG